VTQTETLTPTQAPERERTDEGDHDRFAHYAKKDAIARAYVTGEAIVALCGKKWVPSRDPSRYPICPTCKELKEAGWTLRRALGLLEPLVQVAPLPDAPHRPEHDGQDGDRHRGDHDPHPGIHDDSPSSTGWLYP
jgi:Protein of unknown function (DUF3039)